MDVRDILVGEARKEGVGVDEILGSRRKAPVVKARHEAMWRCYHDLGMSVTAIAKELRKSRSIVLYAIRKHEGGEAFLAGRRERRYKAMIKTGLPIELRCGISGCEWRWTVDMHHESVREPHYLCPNHHSLLHRFNLSFADVKNFAGRYDLLLTPGRSQGLCSPSANPP